MIAKPSVSFLKTSSDPKLVTTTGGILKGMTNNPSFLTPSPPLVVLQSGLDDFSTALARAADGGKTLTARKNDKRAALALLLRELAAYLVVACKGDLAVLQSSGFPYKKNPSPARRESSRAKKCHHQHRQTQWRNKCNNAARSRRLPLWLARECGGVA